MSPRTLWQDLQTYRGEIRRVRQTFPNPCMEWWQLAKQFPRWRELKRPGRTPLDDGLPWITLGALEYLSRLLRPTDRVFEWGSGGSTLYLTGRVREVVTVEHDREWLEKVQAKISQLGSTNWTGSLEEPSNRQASSSPDYSLWSDYASNDDRYRNNSFEQYARRIEIFPEASFDLVLVDGRARPACIHHALSRVVPGGTLMLDNAERDYYGPAQQVLRNQDWILRDFQGPGPYIPYFWSTQFWRKPGDRSSHTEGMGPRS